MTWANQRVGASSAGTAALVLGVVGLFGQVFTSCVGGWFLPVSLAAWALGHRELQKMEALGVPLADLGQARAGHVLGIIGVMITVVAVAFWMLGFGMALARGGGDGPRWMLITDY